MTTREFLEILGSHEKIYFILFPLILDPRLTVVLETFVPDNLFFVENNKMIHFQLYEQKMKIKSSSRIAICRKESKIHQTISIDF